MMKKAVNWIVLSLSLAFVLSAHAARQPLDQVVAVVNQEALMQSELEAKLDSVYQNLRQRNITPPARDVLRKQVLDRLILDTIQMQKAKESGMRVSDTELNKALASVAQQNKMTVDQFRQVLERQGIPFSSVRDQISRELLISQLRQRRVGERIRISEQEVDNFLAQEKTELSNTDYRLQQITVSIPEKATPEQVAAADQKAQEIYQQLVQGEDFSQLAIRVSDDEYALQGGEMDWRRGSELPVLLADQVPAMDINETSVPLRSPSGFHIIRLLEKRGGPTKLVTETLVRHILIAPTALRTEAQARTLVNKLRQRIMQGEDFAELARTYSDDKASAGDGGNLGWAKPGKYVPQFEASINNTSVNGVSPAFRSQFGWHILRVEGRRSQDIGDQLVREQARQQLFKRKFDTELDNWLREQKAAAYIEIR
ncbi:peptidylprolyl isomerase [Oceanospirillum sp. HFRX-1_2]